MCDSDWLELPKFTDYPVGALHRKRNGLYAVLATGEHAINLGVPF